MADICNRQVTEALNRTGIGSFRTMFVDGKNFGAGFGEESALWYAEKYNEAGTWYEKALYGSGGLLASLWTPETYLMTAYTLVTPLCAIASAGALNNGIVINSTRVIQVHKHKLSMNILKNAGYTRKATGVFRTKPLWHANYGRKGHLIFRRLYGR